MNIIKTITSLLMISLIIGCSSTPSKPTIIVETGKVGMIGFGSLMSLKRTEDVFNHKYRDSVYLVHLEGYQRSWDYVTSNYDEQVYTNEDLKYDRYYIRDNDTILYNNTIYLNIREQPNTSMNCVLYMVTEEEIKDMDLYEYGYERIDVTEQIAEYNFQGGKVFAYKATSNYLYNSKNTNGLTVIEQEYFDLVTSACDSIGLGFRQEYDATTNPLNLELVAPVIWKKVR
ncbi:hypothetical protein [Reichenbachiella sp.]|uniref:hypothetical protein n=1 Tax=Reichenbachiella sp. TaxID=2184521 RepID=UPI003B5ABF4D